MRSRRALAAGLVAAAALALGACGGGATTTTVTVEAGAPGPAPGGEATTALFAGIDQDGLMLGRLAAPVTLVVYVEIGDQASAAWMTSTLPELVRRYVRPGRMRIELRLQAPFGDDAAAAEDDVKIARSVVAASYQQHGFEFAQLVFRDPADHVEYDDLADYLRSITKAVPELDGVRLGRDAASPASTRPLKQGRTDFDVFGFSSTPAFRIGRTGGDLRPIAPGALRRAIDAHALPYVG